MVQDYCDVAILGRREGWPQLNALMAAARNREIDCVPIWKFDPFARSTRHLLAALVELDHLGVRIVSVQDQIDTDSPMGRAMFSIIRVLRKEITIMTERNAPPARRRLDWRAATKTSALSAIAILALIGFWFVKHSNKREASTQPSPAETVVQTGRYPFKVARPGPGDIAPQIRLTTTQATPFDLAAMRGKTVLVYFQEGLMCQACSTQLSDIEAEFAWFKLLGINAAVTVTTDAPDLLARKMRDERLTMPVAADPSLAVSQAYHANGDGMMGSRYDAHTFLVVGPNGRILWRANYGGAPAYNKYVLVSDLLADIERGLAATKERTAP